MDFDDGAGEATAAMYGANQPCMLNGQTALKDPQNGRYPDIGLATLENLSAAKAA